MAFAQLGSATGTVSSGGTFSQISGCCNKDGGVQSSGYNNHPTSQLLLTNSSSGHWPIGWVCRACIT